MSFLIDFKDEDLINKTINDLGDSTNQITKSILKEILLFSVKQKYVNIVSKLLLDARIDSDCIDNNILSWAIINKYTEIITLFLKNERNNISFNDEIFIKACNCVCAEAIKKNENALKKDSPIKRDDHKNMAKKVNYHGSRKIGTSYISDDDFETD